MPQCAVLISLCLIYSSANAFLRERRLDDMEDQILLFFRQLREARSEDEMERACLGTQFFRHSEPDHQRFLAESTQDCVFAQGFGSAVGA